MVKTLVTVFLMMAACTQARDIRESDPQIGALCSDTWYRSIEARVLTGDGQGHGPDIGSDEWKSVVEFKLGIRDKPQVPPREEQAWCAYIEQVVRQRRAPSIRGGKPGGRAERDPSYGCGQVASGSIEAMICEDGGLSALDRKLGGVYAAASKKAANGHPPFLKAEQRGWIKGRNECWKSAGKRACVADAYVQRIAELQARYRLVPGVGPVRFQCEGNPANKVVVTFFQTAPKTLIAEHGDSVSLMYVQPSGSGAKYQGRNESFWEHQGEALITWGYGAPAMRCKKVH